MTKKFEKEKDVKAVIRQLLTKHGWYWWMPANNGFGKAGNGDFNAIRAGVFLLIEAKYGSNKPSPMQKAFALSIMAESGISLVVNEKNLPWLEIWLVAFDRSIDAKRKDMDVDPADGAAMLDAMKALTDMLT